MSCGKSMKKSSELLPFPYRSAIKNIEDPLLYLLLLIGMPKNRAESSLRSCTANPKVLASPLSSGTAREAQALRPSNDEFLAGLWNVLNVTGYEALLRGFWGQENALRICFSVA